MTALAPPSQEGMGDASLAPQGAPPAPPSQGGMRDASLAPQGAAQAPSLQGGMRDASLAPQGAAPAPLSQGGKGDASLAPQGTAPAPPSQGGMVHASLAPQGTAPAPPPQGGMRDAFLAPHAARLAAGGRQRQRSCRVWGDAGEGGTMMEDNPLLPSSIAFHMASALGGLSRPLPGGATDTTGDTSSKARHGNCARTLRRGWDGASRGGGLQQGAAMARGVIE
jgi:hypothetical protein